MRVALIFPENLLSYEFSSLKAQERNMGIFPPLSLSYVAAVIENLGHDVLLIDNNALRLNELTLISKINHFLPDLIGFTTTSYTLFETIAAIARIKKDCNVPIIVGGQHVSIYPQETMLNSNIDYAIAGEAHVTLPAFFKAFTEGDEFESVPGLSYRKNGTVVVNDFVFDESHADDIPYPARQLLPNEKYFSFVSRRKNFTGMITSLGCPFRCIFCSLNKLKLRLRSANNVLGEMEECYFKYGIREIDIFDASFSIDKKRTLDICQGILQRKLKLDWSVRTRIDLVDAEILANMAKAGCYLAMYGIESLHPEVQRVLQKDLNLTKVKEIIALSKKAGIMTLGFFMIGSPGETHQTAAYTIKESVDLGLDYVQVTRTVPFPNTELYRMYKLEFGDDYWRDYLSGRVKGKILPQVGTKLTSDEVETYVRKAFLKFYLRPLHIVKLVFKIKTLDQLYKYVRAVIDMVYFA